MDRRRFLHTALGAGSLGGLAACQPQALPTRDATGWDAGRVRHLIPAADATRIRLKLSLHAPLQGPITLECQGPGQERQRVTGNRTDSAGRCFQMDVIGLQPGTRYQLGLQDAQGRALCDDWPLSTLVAANARPQKLRILTYTCAGGSELFFHPWQGRLFLPLAVRRALLARGLSFQPDVLIANGDHVYWDTRFKSSLAMARSPQARWAAGSLDRALPVMGTANEEVIHKGLGPQIADLYGTALRSTPAFFVQDDHDYSDNDEADEEVRTFPPDNLMREVARATQRMYYPELTTGPDLPAAWQDTLGWSTSFGSLRYGQLLELQLFDCRGHMRNDQDPARRDAQGSFIPPQVEAWMVRRMAQTQARHLVHVPSTPVLWSAGKWGEWYPDVSGPDGKLRLGPAKPYWSRGWFEQQARLLRASAQRRGQIPLWVSGDLHATAAGQIQAIEGQALDQPVVSVLAGTLGSHGPTFASKFRGQAAQPSCALQAQEWVRPIEENGFTLLDVDEDSISVSLFRWQPGDGVDKIADLQPFWTRRLARGG